MIKRIHVNRHHVRKNRVEDADLPVLSVATYKGTQQCNHVHIEGPSTVMYRPEKPLKCGARVWIETKHDVVIDGKDRV